ncbi:MAG: helix-turn-helix domain-containing protein, partial [Bacteroidota bacterium]
IIAINELFKLMKSNQHVMNYLVNKLAIEVDSKKDQLLNLAYNSISKRVANALITLNDLFQHSATDGIDIPRDDLANMVGTATASISRMLSDFKANGLIDISPQGAIRINNREALARLNR